MKTSVGALNLEFRKHCEKNEIEKEKNEKDKTEISASFLEVGGNTLTEKCAFFRWARHWTGLSWKF